MPMYKYDNRQGLINRLITVYLYKMICDVSDIISAISFEVRDFLKKRYAVYLKR